VYPTDIPPGLRGQRILIVHGTRDRIASPHRSAALAEALRRRADVRYVPVEGATHAMLRHHVAVDGLAAAFASDTLLDDDPSPIDRAGPDSRSAGRVT
jgi:pimeloyl-ACP methyl ester carboxylesterase